jgi:hypothetical protein
MRHNSSQPCPPARPSTQLRLSLGESGRQRVLKAGWGGLGLFRFIPSQLPTVRAWVGRWYYAVVAFGNLKHQLSFVGPHDDGFHALPHGNVVTSSPPLLASFLRLHTPRWCWC